MKEEIGPLLDEQITEFNPEVVIIQGNSLFGHIPGAYLTMVIDLMEKHPRLPFALEGKQEWLVRQVRAHDHTPWEKRWVMRNQIRWVEHNFIDDDEVEEIINAVFG
ncbi:MAG: hypothetical protein KAT65_11265 [Methanophagales archaeon]|nr:hypothetical protein [Methanophagales archaeon]